MSPEVWKRKIGESAWKHMLGEIVVTPPGVEEDADYMLAAVLDRAVEAGWRAPEREPKISPKGTAVLWPGEESRPVITPKGLLDYYRAKGHAYVILRIENLLRGVGPLLLPRLQEIMMAYEQDCLKDGVSPLPIEDRIFVGADSGALANLNVLRHGVADPVKSKRLEVRKS